MFFFRRNKSKAPKDLSWIGTDLHSHLIPGIDDGVQDLTDSIRLLKGLAALGYRKVVTTPHILWDVYPNTPEIITAGLGDVREAMVDAGLQIEFSAAAEYFIDDHFEDELRNKAPLLRIQDNLVLVEFSMVTEPMDLQRALFEMQLQNYQPLIAHPERYIYLYNRKSFFKDLKDAGCQFQLNLLSLTGHYGNSVQELAEYLVRENAYDYAGTDMHHLRHLEAMDRVFSAPLYERLRGSGQLKNHLL